MRKEAVVDGVSLYYCWTHGLGRDANHTSATCQNPAAGHQYDATINDMKGGSNLIAPVANGHH